MSFLTLLPLNGELLYTFDFTDTVPDNATIVSIDYAVPSQLTQFADLDDLGNKKGSIGLKAHASNGKHGQTLIVTATANLSNNEKVASHLTIRLSGS